MILRQSVLQLKLQRYGIIAEQAHESGDKLKAEVYEKKYREVASELDDMERGENHGIKSCSRYVRSIVRNEKKKTITTESR